MEVDKSDRSSRRPHTRHLRSITKLIKRILTAFKRYWTILRDSGRSRISRFGYVVAGGAGASLSGFALLWIYLLLLIPFTPGSKMIERAKRQIPSAIVSADGQTLATLESSNRKWVGLDQVSAHVANALIATEDHRFYQHDGVDKRRLVSSAFHTAKGDAQGGSTLTMQLARNLFPHRIGNSRSLNRKLKEIVTAKKIENRLSKDEIIETYLNTVPFLYNARGIEMAAHTYFGKDASDLTLPESATLVGMLKGTSYYNPIRHPDRSKARRNVVLRQMVKHGQLSENDYSAIADTPVNAKLRRQRRPARTADHFVNQVEIRARRWADQNGYDLDADGLTVHTTLDSKLQAHADLALRRQSAALQNVANVEWSTSSADVYSRDIRNYAAKARSSHPFAWFWRNKTSLVNSFIRETDRFDDLRATGLTEPDAIKAFRANSSALDSLRRVKTNVESGFIALEPKTGRVLAWVGSRNYLKTPYDHVATSRRQPGSTFKPIVYAAALRSGYRPDDTFRDVDVSIRIGRKDIWQLASKSDDPDETISLRDALAHSRNNITAALMADVGIRRTARLGRKMGIDSSPLVEVPSLALGTSPVTLAEMATIYATIAAEGVQHEPLLIASISNSDGETIASFESKGDRVLSDEIARQLTDMLRTVVDEGTGRRIRNQFGVRADVAGKTGTTQNNMDGWFFLMHPDVVAGAWVGFDDPRVTFRSDFWGEGAHNALFIVGDFFREGLRRGTISSTARFANPSYRDNHYQFADRGRVIDDEDSASRQATSTENSADPSRRLDQDSNGNALFAALKSLGDGFAALASEWSSDWQPEYGENTIASDPTVSDRTAPDTSSPSSRSGQSYSKDTMSGSRNATANEPEGRSTRYSENNTDDRNSDWNLRSRGDNSARSDRMSSRQENRTRSRQQSLREVFDDERFALLEEKREEYAQLTRELERRLDKLRSEPETRELEQIIRDAYLEERESNPSLRRLEERLGIKIDLD